MTIPLRPVFVPTTSDVREAFVDEITSLGGSIADVFDDGERLYLRAVLSLASNVRPGDRVNAGVALRASGPDVLVHPYTFRQVCSNGAIAAHVIDTLQIERIATRVVVPTYETAVALDEIRSAVRACAAPEVFTTISAEMQQAADRPINFITIASLFGLTTAEHGSEIMFRFMEGGDSTVFGLMNAVTSVARHIRDPETRWRLEMLGGTVPARVLDPGRFAAEAETVLGA